MVHCHILSASFCSSCRHDHPIITSQCRRPQNRSVIADHRMPLVFLKATSNTDSSSPDTSENMERSNDQTIRKEDKQEKVASLFDQDTHLRILNDNLKRFSGKSLMQYMKDAEDTDDNKDNSENDSTRNTIGGLMETILEEEEDASNTNTDVDDDDGIDDRSKSWSPDDIHLSMRFALLSHGAVNGMDGPVHNYANFAALSAFSYTRQQMLRIPACRLAAPGSEQTNLSQIYMMLRRPSSSNNSNNILKNHQAFHCTQYLQRFCIRNAIVWNCFDDNGEYYGQALFFDRQKVVFME